MSDINKQVIDSYLTTALWSSIDDNGDPIDSNYSIDDINIDSRLTAENDLKDFWNKAGEFLTSKYDPVRIAHDFWLTRNHHGAGFWDGDYIENPDDGDLLTSISQGFRELYVYIGDDGKVYIE